MTRTRKFLSNMLILLIVMTIWTVGFLLRGRINSPTPQIPTNDVVTTETPNIPPTPTPTTTTTATSTPSQTPPPPTEPPDDTPEEEPPEIPPPPQAEDITDTLGVTLPDGTSLTTLLDDNYNTKRTFGSDTTIEIVSTDDIFSLYVIWDLPPGEWILAGNDESLCGQNNYIHEFVALSSPTTNLTIRCPQNGATLCDIYAFTEGIPPQWVQTWAPPPENADLLVLPTHADDEHLFFVGILPYYAGELGYSTQVAYMTNHWNESPRQHEQLNGLWTVGVRNYPVIGTFSDYYAETLEEAEAIYGYDSFVDYHVELIRRFKPLVVVGHDLNGEYGHGVHMLNAHTLRTAIEYAADDEYHASSFEQYGSWDTPKLYLHLYPENVITLDWDIPLENFNGATAREMAIAGYDCHQSQHHLSFAVPETSESASGHQFGLVRSVPGPDTIGGNLFENIYW